MRGSSIFLVTLCMLIAAISCYAAESEMLKPILEIKKMEEVPEYYGLETKWSVEKKLGSGIVAKATFMNLDVFLAYVESMAASENWAPQKKEAKEEEALKILKNYVLFRIVVSHDTKEEQTTLSDWRLTLLDDAGTNFQVSKLEQEEAELTRGFSHPYYSRVCWAYFPRTKPSGGQFIITEQTKWIKLKFSKGFKQINFAWIFTGDYQENADTSYYAFVKVALVALLFVLIVVIWITRPGKAWRALRKL